MFPNVFCSLCLVNRMNSILNTASKLPKTRLRTLQCIYNVFVYRQRCTVASTTAKNPVIMKLKSPEFYSIFTPELKKLDSIFIKHGYELRIVGGAVRDLLLGGRPSDLDFATTATPDEMKEIFTAENIRMLSKNGEKHGTVTPRIDDRANFEITSLRTDVYCDGRHAEVLFITDWEKDAARRDLTVNALYLGIDGRIFKGSFSIKATLKYLPSSLFGRKVPPDVAYLLRCKLSVQTIIQVGLDGTVYDYVNGYDDLMKRRVVFVGDPEMRMEEDFLRILRYFRFFGRISDNPHTHDERTLKAIQRKAYGLGKISGERIWSELHRILQGNFKREIMETMMDLELTRYMGLDEPDQLDKKCFHAACLSDSKYTLKPITLITSLLTDENKVLEFHARMKLSNYDRDLALFIIYHKDDNSSLTVGEKLEALKYLMACTNLDKNQMREYIVELLKFRDDQNLLNLFEAWELPPFPITHKMIKEMTRVRDSKKIGVMLQKLKHSWVQSDYQMSKDDLLKELSNIQSENLASQKKSN